MLTKVALDRERPRSGRKSLAICELIQRDDGGTVSRAATAQVGWAQGKKDARTRWQRVGWMSETTMMAGEAAVCKCSIGGQVLCTGARVTVFQVSLSVGSGQSSYSWTKWRHVGGTMVPHTLQAHCSRGRGPLGPAQELASCLFSRRPQARVGHEAPAAQAETVSHASEAQRWQQAQRTGAHSTASSQHHHDLSSSPMH